jgi:hypothetical protein
MLTEHNEYSTRFFLSDVCLLLLRVYIRPDPELRVGTGVRFVQLPHHLVRSACNQTNFHGAKGRVIIIQRRGQISNGPRV